MGIHGLYANIGPAPRISLAKLSAAHFNTHGRPFRLAVDISIWLFQIQSGKGGSNPALRTFYYRLLRLLSLNIWPLFVFDGPNKPLFKRNKKVGGPGVRVASVPEFLAKQLLKEFGFPWHVAPGEAEAECALLQREGIVDAVLSEDVDTLMFGSGMTLRSWTAEGSTKTPTHVNVYREEETLARSGLDREGMVLVALMSGGDYLPDGIPGCGPKVACDAARAGFGKELCALRKNLAGVEEWKYRLLHEIRTNESKHFSRKNPSLSFPDSFPNMEVLGYYTHPCVSSVQKLARLRTELKWDQPIDYPALRSFTEDAFDWRCLSGAKKFIRNLAPAMLVRNMRLEAEQNDLREQNAQREHEQQFVLAIHGKRNHSSTDGELEYRIIFTPAKLVPIDLSIEDEDDDFVPAGGLIDDESEAESEAMPPCSTADAEPISPSKKRNFKPYEPDQPEKLWILRPFLQIGCPLLVEEYETTDPKEFLKQRRKARAAAEKGAGNAKAPAKPRTRKKKDVVGKQANSLMQYATITKASAREPLKEKTTQGKSASADNDGMGDKLLDPVAGFKPPSDQIPGFNGPPNTHDLTRLHGHSAPKLVSSQQQPYRPFAAFASKPPQPTTPRRKKRPSPILASPSPAAGQRAITAYYSPSPRHPHVRRSLSDGGLETIDLCTPTPEKPRAAIEVRALTPTPPNTRTMFSRTTSDNIAWGLDDLPDSVTKRRRRQGPLKRARTAPTRAADEGSMDEHAMHESYAPPPDPPAFASEEAPIESISLLSSPVTHLSPLRTTSAPTHITAPTQSAPPTHATIKSTAATITFNPLPSQPRRSPRHSAKSNDISSPFAAATRKPKAPILKMRIHLRTSLEGAWAESPALESVESLDLSGPQVDVSGAGRGGRRVGKRGEGQKGGTKSGDRGWRKSGVDVLDLTGDCY